MELPALIAVLVDAILIKCPQYDRASVTIALESVFAGHPTLLGGNSISMLLGQNNDYTNATITIGDVNAGNQVHVTVTLPQPIDPLPAALAALASIPLTDVPTPRSDLPQASRLPFESSPHFVGREAELNALAQAIGTAQPAVVMPAVATGLGGIGKTSLVTEFSYRYGVYFQGGVFWLNCADPDQVANQIAACAVGLKLDTTGMALDEQVQRVLHAWQSPMPRLLIFDNCEDPAILDQWKPTVGGCRVLVTARSDAWPTLTQIRLGLLSPVESRALLQRLCARLTDAEADAIAEDLGHLPLALHLAGSYLATYPHHTIGQYRKDLTIAHRSLKGRGALPSPTRHELDVEATFMLSFNQLDPNNALDALALGMLDGAAWCAPGVPIPCDLVLALVLAEAGDDGHPSRTTDRDDAVDALRRLQQLGLLNGTELVVLHRLLAQVVQSRLGSLDMLAEVESCLAWVTATVTASGNPQRLTPLIAHMRYVTLRALDRGDLVAIQLADQLGAFEQLHGAYAAAQIVYERALVICGSHLGMGHVITAGILHNLGVTLAHQGRYKEAQAWYEHALVITEQVVGADHPYTGGILSNLGVVLDHQGAYAEALPLIERSIAIRDRVLGADHPDTAMSLNNRGVVLEHQGRYREAQHCYEQAVAITTALVGDSHPTTAKYRSNIALMLERQGQYAAAARIHETVVAIIETVLGAEHPDTAMSLHNWAFALINQGQAAQAQTLMERAIGINERVHGREHRATALCIHHLGLALIHQERYAEAQPILEQAIGIYERVVGPRHPEIAAVISNLGGVLAHQGRYGDAEQCYERALAIREAVLGSEHPDTATTRNNLNSLITAKGYGLRAVLLNNCAVLFASQGCFKDAQYLFEQALALYEPLLRLHHSDTTTVIENMGCLLMLQDRSIEAVGLIERACMLYEQSIGRDHEMTNRLRVYGAELKESIQFQ
ncbi:Tetratricopeptide TPR_2 repeat protein (plasmid) [Herpetosiphon aurantiacus DSM 785]|uniref:Tetratricopeptide TPR_2 repeat protein n=1 Tax=Herpetosiphon aurantiacus (strain ATCC 23779 / DSM 785 / 114-95) TaxID=316274 RepID=A9B984_HERA2|nr:Tetratricopeptide TPR_2 repeat protein [Herpetosiphon aurantiacus DSM 785]